AWRRPSSTPRWPTGRVPRPCSCILWPALGFHAAR
ncbi:MAG: hypothetical protein AVDCRST_MAG50-65, partial [uncultured Acidimicrobiales bacterium]